MFDNFDFTDFWEHSGMTLKKTMLVSRLLMS